jgi:thiol-disulfide isomerase/thioredoxin
MDRRQFIFSGLAALAAGAASGMERSLPALPGGSSRWLNSPPLAASDLANRPVLIEFWTYGCYNCRNTLPWMKATHARHAPRGLVVVAVHTPEFPAERDVGNVRAAIARLGIAYPVLLDPEGEYWAALRNRYWPAFYLFDRAHRQVALRIGELHAGRPEADAFTQVIERLVRIA